MFSKAEKKHKSSYSTVDFRWCKYIRDVDSILKNNGHPGNFTHMEVALINETVLEHYLNETRDMRTVRNIIDY